MIVRRATTSDIQNIRNIAVEAAHALPDTSWYYPDDTEDICNYIHDDGFILLAGGVGFLLARFPRYDHDSLGRALRLPQEDLVHVVQIESVAVRPSHWGRGIQRILLRSMEKTLCNTKYRYFLASTNPANYYSINNFHALGYRELWCVKREFPVLYKVNRKFYA